MGFMREWDKNKKDWDKGNQDPGLEFPAAFLSHRNRMNHPEA